MNIKHTVTVLAGAALLAGCGSDLPETADTSPPPPPPISNPYVTPERPALEQLYLDAMEGAGMRQYYQTDAEAINLADQICLYLERGAGDQGGAADVLTRNAFASADADLVVTFATMTLCPEFV